jgi:cytochrome b subunit of formate dehydrogenase
MPDHRIRRFTAVQRLFHLLLMVSFLIQGATGLARMYIETEWGRYLAWFFGGYEVCLTLHVWVGIFMLAGFLIHFIYLLVRIDWRGFPGSLLGPDSVLLQPRDAREAFDHTLWLVGIRDWPRFDRWGYWEKFDYWAVFWGMVIMGVTGLLLAFSVPSSRIIPGWGLNVAFWIHRIEAILAMGHVFIIHFFIGHLRRHNFPMDHAMFEGSVDLESARHERPAWVARLEADGELERVMVTGSGAGRRAVYYAVGYLALLSGLFLLIGGILNSAAITW